MRSLFDQLNAAVVLVALLCVEPAGAVQVRGVVRMVGGAVIPGARVTLVNPDTTVVREVRSDAVGAYSFATVPIGCGRCRQV